MPLPLQRKKPGDPLAIPAATWNRMVAATVWAEAQQRAAGGGPVGGPTPNAVIIRVKNSSGSDVPAGGILGISEPIFPPTTDPNANTMLLIDVKGVTPTGDHRGAFVVTLEPLRSNAIGRAVIAGACWVKVNAADSAAEDFVFAEANASRTALKAMPAGSARILYRQSGTGDKWALVLIGKDVPAVYPCTVTSDGGTAGTNSTAPSFTYTLKDPDDATIIIATAKSPRSARVVGVHSAGAIGLYRIKPDRSVELWWVDEVPATGPCTLPS